MNRVALYSFPVLALLFLYAPAMAQAPYPAELDALVGLYPQASVMLSQKGADGIQVVLTVADTPAQIMEFYRQALTGKGFTVEQEVNVAAAMTLELTKDGQLLNIGAIPQEDQGSMVSLSLEKR